MKVIVFIFTPSPPTVGGEVIMFSVRLSGRPLTPYMARYLFTYWTDINET